MDYYSNQDKYYEAGGYYPSYSMPSAFPPLDPRLKGHVSENYTYDLTFKDRNVQIKSDDELWVETWLSEIGKIRINLDSTIEIKQSGNPKKGKAVMKIGTARVSIAKCVQTIEKLQKAQEDLKANVATMSSAEWKKKTVEIGPLKDEFLTLMAQFENADCLNLLQKAVQKRKKKRLNHKKKRATVRYNFAREAEERNKADKDIDMWLDNMKESVELAKMEERMKKDADCVLAEVTKKKSDARKQLSLISELVKLRNIREKVATQRGERTSAEDSRVFSDTSEKLQKIWENSLQVYRKEEQGLKIMLEQNASEDSNAIRLSKERRITAEWECLLFGPKIVPSPAYWGLTSAERDLETFIAIRRSWDTFLAQPYDEQGSKIPIGWVLPNADANESWAKFLQN